MPKTFGAGQLRHVIKIQRKAETPNTFGERQTTWVDLSSSVRASVRSISASESFNDPQMTNQITKEFFIRYTTNIGPADRIIYNSETYNIEEILDEDERRRKLLIRTFRVNT